MSQWWVYMLRCADGSLYTGATTDLKRRVAEHNRGEGGSYTRSHRPVTLAYAEPQADHSAALRREAAVKAMSKAKKEELVPSGTLVAGAQPPGTLYLVGTPIGNLEDISARALRVLREAVVIAAEDTRQTRKLLAHFDIHTPQVSCHEHNESTVGPALVRRLLAGEDVALVSDAGMPGISDPGSAVVRLATDAGVRVVPVPGPVAAVAALVASGLETATFTFAGFLPRSGKERRAALARLAEEERTLLLYEAPHRVLTTLRDLCDALGADRPAAAARELTKMFEEIRRTTLGELQAHFSTTSPRGEFTLVIAGKPAATTTVAAAAPPDALAAAVAALEAAGTPRKEAMKRIAREQGVAKEVVYAAVVRQRQESPPAEDKK